MIDLFISGSYFSYYNNDSWVRFDGARNATVGRTVSFYLKTRNQEIPYIMDII